MGKMIDREEVVELVLSRVKGSGAEYGDVRMLESRTQVLYGEDRRIARIQDSEDSGFGVRVLYQGAWGFASSSVLAAGEVRRVTELAIEIAKASATLVKDPVKLCPEPVHVDSVVTSARVDPFAVPLEEKTRLLLETMERLHKQAG
ncbi:MAG: TldD/PmbA family protein, partial [Nitrospirales bacterium]|nr:TldD/PmbA family protein [Nitrospirales bacterium]